eukprot:1951454-Pleurochrysis_carterae.AAC.1
MAMIHMCNATPNGTLLKAPRKTTELIRPSTGFVAVVLALSMCENVSLFGMDDPSTSCSNFHYYEDKPPNCNISSKKEMPLHWLEKEHALYRMWHRQGKLKLVS